MVRASRLPLLIKILGVIAGMLLISFMGGARGQFVESLDEEVSLTSSHGSAILWTDQHTENVSEWTSRFKAYADLRVMISGPVGWSVWDPISGWNESGSNGPEGRPSRLTVELNGTPVWLMVETFEIGSNGSRIYNFGRISPVGAPVEIIDRGDIPMIALSAYWSMIYRVLIWTGVGMFAVLIPLTVGMVRFKRGRVIVR